MENQEVHNQAVPPQTIPPVQPIQAPSGNQKKSMRVKKILLSIIIILLGAGALSGYYWFTKQSNGHSSKRYQGKIVIGYTAWPGYVGLYLARDKGYFKEAGLDVEMKIYDGFIALSDAYTSGAIQGKANITIDALTEAYKGFNHKAIIQIDYSNGSDGIIAKSEIKNFEQVKGKRWAFEHGGLEEFFTTYALRQYQLTLKDIVPVNLDAEEAANALAKGEVDIATTYEPFLTKTVKQIHGNKIYTSADAPGLISDILTFRSDFVDQYPETVQAIVTAYFKGISFWQKHPQEANLLLAKELNVTPEEAVEQLKGITVLNLHDNATAFTFAAGLQSIYGNMRQTNKFVKSQNIKSTVKVDPDGLVDATFIKNLSEK